MIDSYLPGDHPRPEPERSSKTRPSRLVFNVARLWCALAQPSPIREMTKFHGPRTALRMEGFMRPKQYKWFEQLFQEYEIEHIAEVGFNGGHSAFAFASLGAMSITSFDIGEHSYVQPAAAFLEGRFPNTVHELIIGDSRKTLSKYETKMQFDAVFIDGGHDRAIAASDINNFHRLSKHGTLVIMDDYGRRHEWGLTGPQWAYNKAVYEGIIEHIEIQTGDLRGWALGRFIKPSKTNNEL